jgi:hypothetical protein
MIMATAEEIQGLEAKLKAAKDARLANVGDLAIAPIEEITLGKFNYHGDALRLTDPLKFAAVQRNLITRFVKEQMTKGEDYGVLPGTQENMLYKAGAERLANLFNYSIEIVQKTAIEDYDKPLFAYTYTAFVKDCSGRVIAQSDGQCNSMEKKYRWRNVKEKWATADEKSKAVSKKEFKGEVTLVLPNDDVFSIINTIMKMSEKRAAVGSIILACNASAYFKNAETHQEISVSDDRPTWKTIDADVVEDNDSLISEPQRRRLFAIATDSGYSKDGIAMKAMLATYGIESSKSIKVSQYDLVCKVAENKPMAAFWNSQTTSATEPEIVEPELIPSLD